MPVFSVHTLDMDVQAGLTTERILGYLSTLFAALATLLAGIGLYGVLAYSIVRRTREIGIRFAIGAQKRDVAGLFARESLTLVVVGLIIGAPVALVSAYASTKLALRRGRHRSTDAANQCCRARIGGATCDVDPVVARSARESRDCAAIRVT